jgi:phage-related protein
VLHCFIKKSAKTASLDVQLIQLRYRRVLQRMRDDEK